MNCPKVKVLRNIIFLLVLSLLLLYPVCIVFSQASSTTIAVVPSSTTARVGDTVTVNITISNVQNLYALDVILQWNTSALQVVTAESRLGIESHPDGVLHNEIQVVEDNVTQEIGQYRLVATSIAPASSFSGSGNIAIVTFNVTSLGHSDLILTTELADYNPEGSNFIDHTDVNGVVDVVIPEFSSVVILVLLLIGASFVIVFSKRFSRKDAAV